MSNREIHRNIKMWKQVRQDWIDILNARPDGSEAPLKIIEINSKIQLLTGMYDFTQDIPD